MKGLILKLVVLKIIQILILSQFVFAQSFDDDISEDDFDDDSFNNDDFGSDEGARTEFGTNSVGFDDEKFRDEIHDDGGGIRTESGDDERYEFRERKDYSYQPDFGPEYVNKEEMLFGRLFHLIEEDINEFEMMKLCGEPEKIADITIDKVKAKIGDISNACEDIESHETECKERIEQDCSQIGKPDLRFARDEREKKQMQAFACPPNKDLMVELCVEDSREWIDDRLQYLEGDCEIEWQRYGSNDPGCKEIDQQCNEDAYIDQCIDRYKPFEEKCPEITPPNLCEGRLETQYDNKGCIIGYSCINDKIKEECHDIYEPVCGNDGITYYNSCKAEKAGIGYRFGECRQCQISDEDAKRKEEDCRANNGNPETIYDGECVQEVRCHIDDSQNQITGNVAGISGAFTYEEAKSECEREWERKQDYCRDLKQRCDKDAYVDACIAREKKNIEFNLEDSKRQCERNANMQIKHQVRECSRMDFERQRCLDEGSRQCSQMEGLASECKATMTEENFRAFIIREAEKHCKFLPFIKEKEDFAKYDKMEIVLAVLDTVSEEEISKLSSIVENLNKKFELDGKIVFEGMISPNRFVDIKSLNFVVNAKLNAPESSETAKERKLEIISRLNPEKVVEKLLELRETDISSEYKYLIEDRASDLLEASDEIDEVEEKEESKGFGYKIRLFLGLAKDLEESEIQSLERSKQRLETSIATLSKLADTVPDDIAKAILKAQVEDLERQKADMDDLVEKKKNKAKGLLGLFGLFG